MAELVSVDIGGTNARFAIATTRGDKVVEVAEPTVLATADHATFEDAWRCFAVSAGRRLPPAAALAIAAPVDGELIKLTSNPWTIARLDIPRLLAVERHVVVNDFGAVGHAVAQVGPDHLRHICGPEHDLPAEGVITIVGPGTGLGVAQVMRHSGRYVVGETEGGHIGFAPVDEIDDGILDRLRDRFGRVSAERVAAGPGLANIHRALTAMDGRDDPTPADKVLWAAALGGDDVHASAALDRFCRALGTVTGDLALAHGAVGVVIAGGVGLRLASHLPRSAFSGRFVAKGRFEGRMAALPVKVITHPQPGLFGAAAAFAQAFPD